MKLIIQIPCFNEEHTLPAVFKNMPDSIPGIDEIEYQIIDDGSTDRTIKVAKALGVHHVVRIKGKNRRWLGRAFKAGVDNALKNGADILVNTDGDNQYPSTEIARLVEPIVSGQYDIAIGDRKPTANKEFSLVKRALQWMGSSFIQFLTKEPVSDAVSGFRAYSKDALLKINVFTKYTYTVDTLIQANKKGIDICWVPIKTNPKTRESRLITNIFSKVRKSGLTILRMYVVYEPFKTFMLLALVFFAPGAYLLGRFAYFYLAVPAQSAGHVQSVVVGGVCIVIAFLLFALGVIGDLLAVNRTIHEEILTRLRGMEADAESEDSNLETFEDKRKTA